MVAILIILFYFGKIKQIDIGKKNSPISKIFQLLCCSADNGFQMFNIRCNHTEGKGTAFLFFENRAQSWGPWNCHVALWIFCSHVLIVMCPILNVCVHSFIIHSNKNLSWKQRHSPPSSTPTNQHLLPACELILESAGVCLWSQPAACVCQRADVTGGNEGWTLGPESQP